MLVGLYIIVDEDFDVPIYADPEGNELEPEVWSRVCEVISEGLEGEGPTDGVEETGAGLLGWRVLTRNGLSFVTIVKDASRQHVEKYLKQLVRLYFDEVDDVRRPEKEGVADVVVDVIPPWEDED